MYPHDYTGKHFDWPGYRPVQETREEVEHCKYEYAALLSMCDAYLGKVMDTMDECDLWQDTMLIVTTDHGFLFGEHDWWAKNIMPTHMASLFSVQELQEMELADPFSFTKGVRTLKIPAASYIPAHRFGTLLYDLAIDPEQKLPIQDAVVEKRMIDHLIRIMNLHHAPPEQFER